MSNLSEEIVNAIFLQIVQDMRFRPGLSVNTFGVTDQEPDLLGTSFGYAYSDFLTGSFWSRTWANQGANISEMSGEFPALFTEFRSVVPDVEDSNQDSTRYTFTLVLVDRIACPKCPEEVFRNGIRVQNNVIGMLRAVLKEFLTYRLYDIGGELFWLSDGRADVTAGADYPESDIFGYVAEVGPVRRWGNFEDLRGAFVDVSLDFCWLVDSAFNYSGPVAEPLARVTCNDCP